MEMFNKLCKSLVYYPYHLYQLGQIDWKIDESVSTAAMVNTLNGYYSLVKQVADYDYVYGGKHTKFNHFMDCLCGYIGRMPLLHILEASPEFSYFDEKYKQEDIRFYETVEEKIEYIVWRARRELMDKCGKVKHHFSFDTIDETNWCGIISKKVKKICYSLGVECKLVKIVPGYTEAIKLYNGFGYHYFTIIKIEGLYYLVDCTYRQFFKLERCLLNRLGIPNIMSCSPGAYMVMNASRKETALQLLKKGYILLNKENFKNYLDGFTLSFRNGLYYENMDELHYDVSYTVDDYEGFLKGEDCQIFHEPISYLGFQWECLHNKDFNFEGKKLNKIR